MRSILIVFATILLIIALPFVFDAIDNAQTEAEINTFSNVAVGSGNATVYLSTDAHNDAVADITTISSNSTLDSPTAFSYTTASRGLVVTGLADSNNRTLSVTYNIDSTTLPSGAATVFTVIRWFYIFCIVGFFGGAVYAFFD